MTVDNNDNSTGVHASVSGPPDAIIGWHGSYSTRVTVAAASDLDPCSFGTG